MGIYDRPYYRDDQPRGFSLSTPRSMVTTLIWINVAIFVADFFTGPAVNENGIEISKHWLSHLLSLNPEFLSQPWQWWRFVTYGFAHAPYDKNVLHILFNMYMLWLFGREVESLYGSGEFLLLYLFLIVASGLVWVLIEAIVGGRGGAVLIGASGATIGIMILFILHFPHREFFLLFIPRPIPAWIVGVICIALNVLGALQIASRTNVAYTCHLAGAAFAFLYYKSGLRFQRGLSFRFSLKALKPRPKLRVHDPESRNRELDQRADRILGKLHREGADSLTGEERRILEEYSRRMRQKHS